MCAVLSERNVGIILMLLSGMGWGICNLLYNVLERSISSLAVIFCVDCVARIILCAIHDVFIGMLNYYNSNVNTNNVKTLSDYIIVLSIFKPDQIKEFKKVSKASGNVF